MTITDDSGEKTGDSGEGPLDIQKSFFTIHFSEERQREKERKKTQRKSRGARIGISKSVGKMIRISQQPEIRRKYSSGTGCRGRPVTWRVTHGPDGIRGTGKVPRVRVVSSLGWFKAGCCFIVWLHFLNHVSCPHSEASFSEAAQSLSGHLGLGSCKLMAISLY